MKEGLLERGQQISSYRLAGKTEERGHTATFSFEFRAPNRMRGELLTPLKAAYAFDGTTLYARAEGKGSSTPLRSAEEGALLLAQTFSPFAPEGYRSPLVLREGLSAERAEGQAAVRLIQVIEGQTHQKITYLLRWPSLDFLEKRLESTSGTATDRVDAEHCEKALGRCFPQRVVHLEGQEAVGVSTVTAIEINPVIPADRFTLPVDPR